MFSVPVTFCAPFHGVPANYRRIFMHEFAVNGAKHIVLGCDLIPQMMQDYKLGKVLSAEMAAEGLSFVDAHAPFGLDMDLFCPDPYYRKMMIARQRLAIQLAGEMHAGNITIHVGNSNHCGDTPVSEHLKRVNDALALLIPEAESCGITISIENIWTPLTTPDSLLEIKRNFPTDTLGFCYDSGHAHLFAKDMGEEHSAAIDAWAEIGQKPPYDDKALEKMLPHIVTCHLHDNWGVWDNHRNPGEGTIDWNYVIPLLKKAPRLKMIQSEVILDRENISIRDVCEAFRKIGEIE